MKRQPRSTNMHDLNLIILCLAWVAIVYVPVIALFKGVSWWRVLGKSERRPRVRVPEAATLLLSLVPGVAFIMVMARERMFVLPLGLATSFGMGCGAFLGRLCAYARASVPAGSSAASTMVNG